MNHTPFLIDYWSVWADINFYRQWNFHNIESHFWTYTIINLLRENSFVIQNANLAISKYINMYLDKTYINKD